MDPVKVAGVAAWPTPKNKKDVQQFLGFTNFCRRFIRALSDVAWPLFNLMKKGVAWTWTWTTASAAVFTVTALPGIAFAGIGPVCIFLLRFLLILLLPGTLALLWI
jgi:hypothetical protein